MCKKWFQKKSKKIVEMEEKWEWTAENVRRYAIVKFVEPVRKKGGSTVTFSSRVIHEGMQMAARFPLVCGSIDADKFLNQARVTLLRRSGPHQGATVQWTFVFRK
jgi:hypothetical protein